MIIIEIKELTLKKMGIWRRPMAYGGPTSRELVAREYSVVRNGVGIIDVSTLGKIELFGRCCIFTRICLYV